MFGLPVPLAWVPWIARVLVVVALLLIGRMWGMASTYEEWIESNAETAVASAKVVQSQIVVTEKVRTEYVERVKVLDGITTTIQSEVTRYVESKPLTMACLLDLRWVGLHNAAAAGTLPPPASGADGTSSTITLADALQPITGNYATYHQVAARLTALQRWVREQFLATNGKPLEP